MDVAIRDPEPVFYRRGLPDDRGGGGQQPGTDAGGHVSADEYSGGGGGDVLLWNAARADRNGHHQPIRAVLHTGQRDRAHRIAVAAGGQRDQGVLPTGLESRLGGDYDLEPGDGAVAEASSRDAATRRAEV